MIVIGTDVHKESHCCAAVEMGSGRRLGVREAPARGPGFRALLEWARELGGERVWAIEDCRHVSGSLERFLIGAGERIVRLAPKLSAGARRSERERGKSDPIDALAIARAAVREGIDTLPAAFLDEQAREIKLLADHREALVGARTREQNRLRWLLHDRWPELEIPAAALDRERWLERVGRRLAQAIQSADVRIARELVREIRSLTRRAREIERELAALVSAKAPMLLQIPGCGVLTAARIIAETAGPGRFSSDAKLARTAGVAPIPASSGARHRHRLDRGGNRKLNAAFHRIAIVQGRTDPEARAYLARKQTEGKSRREAVRCLKRFVVRRVWHLLPKAPSSAGARTSAIASEVLALT
jgi:transposase